MDDIVPILYGQGIDSPSVRQVFLVEIYVDGEKIEHHMAKWELQFLPLRRKIQTPKAKRDTIRILIY